MSDRHTDHSAADHPATGTVVAVVMDETALRAADPAFSFLIDLAYPVVSRIMQAQELYGQQHVAEAAAELRECDRHAADLKAQLSALDPDWDHLRRTLNLIEDSGFRDVLETTLLYVMEHEEQVQGRLAFVEADLYSRTGQFGQSSARYTDVVRLLGPCVPDGIVNEVTIQVGLAQVMAPATDGWNLSRLGKSNEAIQRLQMAVAQIKTSFGPLVDRIEREGGDPVIVAGLRIPIASVQSSLQAATITNDLANENFATARKRAQALQALHDQMAAKAHDFAGPEPLRLLILWASEIGTATAKVLYAYSAGEAERDAGNWQDAMAFYDEAEAAMQDAALALAAIPTTGATDVQAQLINSTMIRTARRRCEENRESAEEIARMKAEVATWKNAMSEIGRQVNVKLDVDNRNEAVATVSNEITVLTSIVEMQLRSNLRELAASRPPVGVSDTDWDAIVKRAEDLDKARETGKSFIDRVCGFVKGSAEVLGKIADAVEPAAKILQIAKGFAFPS